MDEQRQEQEVGMLNTYCKSNISSEAENVISCSDKRLLSLTYISFFIRTSCSTLFQMQSLFHLHFFFF